MEVEITVEYEDTEVVAAMAMDGDYPRMKLERLER